MIGLRVDARGDFASRGSVDGIDHVAEASRRSQGNVDAGTVGGGEVQVFGGATRHPQAAAVVEIVQRRGTTDVIDVIAVDGVRHRGAGDAEVCRGRAAGQVQHV